MGHCGLSSSFATTALPLRKKRRSRHQSVKSNLRYAQQQRRLQSSAAPHSFQKTRSFDAITGLEAKSRGTQQFYAIEGPFYCIILLLNRLSFSNPNKNLCKCGTTEYHLLAHFGLIRPSLKQAIVVWVPIFVYFWPFCAGIWQFYALFIRCQ